MFNFCIWCKVMVQINSFTCGYLVAQEPFVEKNILSLLTALLMPIENQLSIDV